MALPAGVRGGVTVLVTGSASAVPGLGGRHRRQLQQQLQRPGQRLLQRIARHHHVEHAVFHQVLGALEALGQGLTDGGLDHPLAGKADQGPGFGDVDVADHGEGGGDAAGGRVGEDHDIGQAGFLHPVDGDRGAGHLHQRQRAFLHAGTARGGEDDQRTLLLHGDGGGLDQAFAHAHAHRSAQEIEIEHRNHGRHAADAALAHLDGVGLVGLGLGLAQTVGIALAVAEAQRIGRHLRGVDPVIGVVVEQHGEPLLRRQAHVMSAIGADMQIFHQIAVEDHLLAGRALVPEIVRRRVGLADQGLDLRTDEVRQPAHAVGVSVRMPGAGRVTGVAVRRGRQRSAHRLPAG